MSVKQLIIELAKLKDVMVAEQENLLIETNEVGNRVWKTKSSAELYEYIIEHLPAELTKNIVYRSESGFMGTIMFNTTTDVVDLNSQEAIDFYSANKSEQILNTYYFNMFNTTSLRFSSSISIDGPTLSMTGYARINNFNVENYDIQSHGWHMIFDAFTEMVARMEYCNRPENKQYRREALETAKSRYTGFLHRIKNQMKHDGNAKTETGLATFINKREWNETFEETNEQFTKLIADKMQNTLTARTWGWEVEVPDAKGVNAPDGVQKGDDGSLRSYEGNNDCECDCDSCYYHECDCEHCETGSSDPDHDCGSSACTQADSAEFRTVGGIQRSVHGALNRLCADLDNVEAEKNDTAGTHIHVWAGDLNAEQVANVMACYIVLQKMFNSIAGRANVNYSRYVSIDDVRTALRQKKFRQNKTQDVNINHLFNNNRRTIEFRQMDCNLDGMRINAWAWMVRGLVTAAKRGMTIADAAKVHKISDYVDVLAKFNVTPASEAPEEVVYGSRTDMPYITQNGLIKQLVLA